MNNIFKIGLFLLACVLSYLVFASIMAPIKFQDMKKERYLTAIERLMQIRDAQLSYKEANGKYTASFDSLKGFIDSGKIALVTRKDTAIQQKDNRGVMVWKDITRVDTIGYVSVKDSLFKGIDYSNLGKIKFNENEHNVELKAQLEEIEDSEVLAVYKPQWMFKASIDKAAALDGAEENDILVEKNQVGGIEGDDLTVGSLSEPSTEGNWTKDYEQALKDKK